MRYNINVANLIYRGIAQLVEQWSPKPRAVGSNPTAPARKALATFVAGAFFVCFLRNDEVRRCLDILTKFQYIAILKASK